MKKFVAIIAIMIMMLPINIFAVESTSDTVTLSNCVDGNSARFMLGLSEIKVKFLGIESEEIYEENTSSSEEDEEDASSDEEKGEDIVSKYVCEMFQDAKSIKIEYDPGLEKEDKYGRIQAWVFVDGELLQENLVKNGYAKVMYLNEDFLYIDELKEAQNYARENKLGIWKNEEVVDSSKEEKEDKEEEEKSKGFFQTIIDFFSDIFQKILDFIDDLINNIF